MKNDEVKSYFSQSNGRIHCQQRWVCIDMNGVSDTLWLFPKSTTAVGSWKKSQLKDTLPYTHHMTPQNCQSHWIQGILRHHHIHKLAKGMSNYWILHEILKWIANKTLRNLNNSHVWVIICQSWYIDFIPRLSSPHNQPCKKCMMREIACGYMGTSVTIFGKQTLM